MPEFIVRLREDLASDISPITKLVLSAACEQDALDMALSQYPKAEIIDCEEKS